MQLNWWITINVIIFEENLKTQDCLQTLPQYGCTTWPSCISKLMVAPLLTPCTLNQMCARVRLRVSLSEVIWLSVSGAQWCKPQSITGLQNHPSCTRLCLRLRLSFILLCIPVFIVKSYTVSHLRGSSLKNVIYLFYYYFISCGTLLYISLSAFHFLLHFLSVTPY